MRKVGVVHYDEIALKGGNRKLYEQALVTAIARKIAQEKIPYTLSNRWGRIIIEPKTGATWRQDMDAVLQNILQTTPGVAVFGFGIAVESERECILAAVRYVAQYIEKDFETFKIATTRTDKNFSISSQEMSKVAGSAAFEILGDKKRVDLKNADLTIRIEILTDIAYVYVRENGLSGLPVSSSGKAVALLSGGFDSPVAVHMCAVRGVRPILVHFHAYPHTSRASLEKVEDLGRVLSNVCGPIVLYMIPLLEAQKEISFAAPERLRVVLYRRLMMRVAEEIARKENGRAIITGESVGQVASQTLENMRAVGDATTLPIIRPLAGMNKREIIDRAREIGTHDISVLPHEDTCTVFMPKQPETRATLEEVHEAEKLYDSKALVAHMLKETELIKL
tara:strand:+ start:4683 stop:5864 length:1182 start_codon:yes stop_codon:yes gene_type:complete